MKMFSDPSDRAVAITPLARPTSMTLEVLECRQLLSVGTPVSGARIDTSQGLVTVRLYTDTPITTANFLRYTNEGLYNNTVIHRSVPGFVVQGGGFSASGANFPEITPKYPAIQNEFSPSRPNIRGTVAMAKVGGDPNSATSQWFFNLADNRANLDNQNGGFTTFATVIGKGMEVVDSIAALPRVSATGVNPAFSEVPVVQANGQNNVVIVKTAKAVSVLPVTIGTGNEHTVRWTDSGGKENTATMTDGTADLLLAGENLTHTIANGVITVGGSNVSVENITTAGTAASKLAIGSNNAVITGPAQVVTLNTTFTIGEGGNRSITWVDADGTRTTLTAKGAAADLQFAGSGITSQTTRGNIVISGTGVALSSLAVRNSVGNSNLTFNAKGGDGQVGVGTVTVDGPVGTINGKSVSLGGNLTASGPVGTLTLLNAGAGGTISVPSVKSLNVGGSLAAGVQAGALSGAKLGNVTGGTWTVTGNVGNVSATSLSGVTINAANVGKVTSKGAVTDSTIRASGNIASVAAASMNGSRVYAGVNGNVNGVPATAAEYANTTSTIGNVALKKGAASYVNSVVAAPVIRKLNLGTVQTGNSGTAFGVGADTLSSLVATIGGKKASVRNVTTQQQLDAYFSSKAIELGDTDFVIV